MYYFLTSKLQKIDDSELYLIQVLFHDTSSDNFSVARMYTKATEESKAKIDYFSQYQDITDYIGSKVRNDGKVVLTLK